MQWFNGNWCLSLHANTLSEYLQNRSGLNFDLIKWKQIISVQDIWQLCIMTVANVNVVGRKIKFKVTVVKHMVFLAAIHGS